MTKNTFLSGSIAKAQIKFAIPLMFALILQGLYGAVDLWVVGRFASTASVSAVATGSQVMHAFTVIIMGLTMGVTVLVSRAVGEGNPQNIPKIIGGQIKLFAVVTLIITLFCIFFAESLANIMQMPIEAMSQTISYIRICGAGMIWITAYNGISGIFRGLGNSKSPFVFVLIACICNIILDIIFVKFLNLATTGAALATVISQAISVVFSIYYMLKSDLPFVLTKEMFKKTQTEKRILKIGSPIAIQDFLTAISFLIITSLVNKMGVVASASMGVIGKLFMFISLVPTSFMSTLSAFVSQNIGAKQYDRAKKSLEVASLISLSTGILVSYMCFMHGDLLASIFTNDAAVIEASRAYLHIESSEYLILSVAFCVLGYFNGLGRTHFVMIQGLFATFAVRIPISYYVSQLPNASIELFGYAAPISAGSAFILSLSYLTYLRKSNKEFMQI